jgi:conjugative transfer region protein TrbK
MVWIAAIVSAVSAVAVTAIQSRRGEDAAVPAAMERGTADALSIELARCRTIASDETEALESCRRIWAENRRNFFQSTKAPLPVSAPSSPTSAGSVKKGDRNPSLELDQGRAY